MKKIIKYFSFVRLLTKLYYKIFKPKIDLGTLGSILDIFSSIDLNYGVGTPESLLRKVSIIMSSLGLSFDQAVEYYESCFHHGQKINLVDLKKSINDEIKKEFGI